MNNKVRDIAIRIAVRNETVEDAVTNSLTKIGFLNIASIGYETSSPISHGPDACDLLISDLKSGDSSSPNLIIMMKKELYPKRLPVLLVAGEDEKGRYLDDLRSGLAYDFIEHPFTIEALKKKIFKCAFQVFSERLRILVVDDAAAMRDSLKFTLQQIGFKDIEMVSSGSSALDKMKIEPCDIVITDVNMPGMSGIDLVTEMKRDEALSRIPILALTAENEKDRVLSLIKAGVSAYILKPYTLETLQIRMLSLATYLL